MQLLTLVNLPRMHILVLNALLYNHFHLMQMVENKSIYKLVNYLNDTLKKNQKDLIVIGLRTVVLHGRKRS